MHKETIGLLGLDHYASVTVDVDDCPKPTLHRTYTRFHRVSCFCCLAFQKKIYMQGSCPRIKDVNVSFVGAEEDEHVLSPVPCTERRGLQRRQRRPVTTPLNSQHHYPLVCSAPRRRSASSIQASRSVRTVTPFASGSHHGNHGARRRCTLVGRGLTGGSGSRRDRIAHFRAGVACALPGVTWSGLCGGIFFSRRVPWSGPC